MVLASAASAPKGCPEDPEIREHVPRPLPKGLAAVSHAGGGGVHSGDRRLAPPNREPVCREMSLQLHKSVVLSAPCTGK